MRNLASLGSTDGDRRRWDSDGWPKAIHPIENCRCAARLAYRELWANPDLTEDAFQAVMGTRAFGPNWRTEEVQDTLELCRVFGTDRDWTVPAPLTAPGRVESRRKSGRLDAKKRSFLRDQLVRVRVIAERHRGAATPGERELARIARWL